MHGQGKKTLSQVSGSLHPNLGGPTTVIMNTTYRFSDFYIYNSIVFGSSIDGFDTKCINPTFLNNRFGFNFRIPNKNSRRILKSSDIIIIHGYYLWSTLIALYYSATPNIFLMPHGSLERYQNKKGKFRKYIFRKIATILLGNRSMHFLVGSESEILSIREIFPIYPISVVGLGIEISNDLNDLSQIHDPINLFCLSRISHKKRIDLCIHAISKLNSVKSRYKLKIYGSGDEDLEDELKRLVKTLKVQDSVSFEGHVDGISKKMAIKNSDILLLPSENENFAVAVAESISFGKPVVVSKFVAMHEFVDRFKAGITIDCLEIDEIVLAIEQISDNFSIYQRNCLTSARLLDWNEVFKRWHEVIESNLVEYDK
jgi:glycosyltransferase involved in cell wall biosynthesis